MAIRSPGSAARPTAFEFFAGGGLAGLGLAAGGAGFQTAFANDLSPAKAQAFGANHPEVALHEGDVWNLGVDDLPGSPDLCWASSPCQDVSLAGVRGGLEARRSGAFWGFWRLMQALDAQGRGAPIVVVENVVGLLSSGEGRDFAAVCTALVEAGYEVGALEVDACAWLPQSRPRLFIIGMRGVSGPQGPRPVAPFHSRRLLTAHARLPQAVRARWAWWSLAEPARRNLDLAGVLEPDGAVNWFDAAETEKLLALTAPLHRRKLDEALASGERQVAAAFRRVRVEDGVKMQRLEVRLDGLAGCLRTPSGGSSRQYVLVCDQGRVRARRMTGREAARLMGVPEDYILPRSENAALTLMGDAVATPVVRALTEQLFLPALTRG